MMDDTRLSYLLLFCSTRSYTIKEQEQVELWGAGKLLATGLDQIEKYLKGVHPDSFKIISYI